MCSFSFTTPVWSSSSEEREAQILPDTCCLKKKSHQDFSIPGGKVRVQWSLGVGAGEVACAQLVPYGRGKQAALVGEGACPRDYLCQTDSYVTVE